MKDAVKFADWIERNGFVKLHKASNDKFREYEGKWYCGNLAPSNMSFYTTEELYAYFKLDQK